MKHNVYFSVPSKLDYICKYLAGSSYSNICLQRTTASGRSYRPDFLIRTKILECSNYFFIVESPQIEYCSDYA